MADMKASVTLSLIDKLTGQVGKPRRGFNDLRRAARDLTREFKGLERTSGQSQNTLKQKINQTTAALRKQSSALRELGQRYRQTSRDMKTSGLMDAAGGVAMIYGGKKLVDGALMPAMQAAHMEAALDKLSAIGNFSQGGEIYKRLEAKARELGSSTTFSGTQVTEGMQYQAMAGLKPEQILKAIGPTLDLAKATDTDLARSSDHITNIMSTFKLEWSETQKVADLLAFATTKANVNLEELAETVKYTGSMANTAGVKLDHVTAITGYLGDQGIKASMAGTHTRAIIQRLAAPPKASKEALQKLGISTLDADGNVRGLLSILKDLNLVTKGMGSGEKIKVFKDIGGIIAGGSLSKLVDGIDGLETKLKVIQTGYSNAARRMADEMSNNLIGDLKAASSAFEELQNTLGGPLQKDLRSAAQSITGLVNDLSEWGKNNEGWVKGITATAGALGAVVAALGIGKIGVGITKFALSPLISVAGKLSEIKAGRLEKVAHGLTSMSEGINKAKPSKIRALAGGLKGLALSLNPWMVAAGAGVGAFALIDWLNDLPKPHERAAKAADKHKEALANLGGTAKQTAKEFMAMTRAQRENRVIELQGLVADLKNQRQALGDKLGWQASKIDAGWGGAYSDEARAKAWAKHRNLTVTDANSEQLQKLYQLATTKAKSGDFASALREAILQNPEWQEGLEADRKLVQQYLAIQKQEQTAAGQVEHTRALLKAGDAEQAKDKLGVVQADIEPFPKPRNIEDEITRAFAGHFKTMDEAIASQKAVAGQGQSGANEGKTKAQVTTHIGPVTINNNGIGTEEAGRKISAQLNQLNQSATNAALYDNEMVMP